MFFERGKGVFHWEWPSRVFKSVGGRETKAYFDLGGRETGGEGVLYLGTLKEESRGKTSIRGE